MSKIHSILAIIAIWAISVTTILANNPNTEDPISGINNEKAKTTAPSADPIKKAFPMLEPPTDSLKRTVYADSLKSYQLKGHYLTRKPFDNSVPSYDLKSKFSGLDQTKMDVQKL